VKYGARLTRLKGMAGMLTAALATSGCSYFEQFFIVNGSDVPVTVVATASVYPHADTGARICSWSFPQQPPTELRGIDASRLRSDYVPFDQLGQTAAVDFDERSCSVRVTIEPGVAVLAWSSSNGQRWRFLTAVTLGERGAVVEGNDLLKRFRKRSRAVYMLQYK
jgi:hypothetical protein